ncbi:MAG: hypothetical protein ACM3ON_09565 [Chloroflexota bacterium]
MPNGEIEFGPIRGSIIAQRIGPIFDPAFLKLIPKDKIKDIVVIQMEAQMKAMREELKAAEEITKMVKEIQIR